MNWVAVYKAENAIEAHLIRGLLEAESIPVRLSGESLSGAIGELPADVAQVDVLVPGGFSVRARGLVQNYEESSGD
jgi:hypothetical protein